MKSIVQTEGITGLWRGLSANVVGVAPARAMYFYTYRKMKTFIGSDHYTTPFIAAGTAGIATSTFTCPIWLIKTRIQLQSQANPPSNAVNDPILRNYTGYSDCIQRVYREEGIRGFYKGLSASYWNVFEGAFQFMLYERMKRLVSVRE